MNVEGFDCAKAERDVAARYLTGALSEAESEAFETHFVSCPRCWSEIEGAGGLREAFGRPFVGVAPTARAKVSRDPWTLLAAAAAVAALAIGLAQLKESAEPIAGPVLRSESTDVLDMTLKAGPGGQVILEWTAHPNAQAYVLEIMTSDGVRVMQSETTDT